MTVRSAGQDDAVSGWYYRALHENFQTMGSDDLEALQGKLRELGNLHDARVIEIDRTSESGDIVFHLDDIYSNFQGLGSYPGAVPGRLAVRGVTHVGGPLTVPEDAAGIWEITVTREMSGVALNVRLFPEGQLRVECGSVSLQESPRDETRV